MKRVKQSQCFIRCAFCVAEESCQAVSRLYASYHWWKKKVHKYSSRKILTAQKNLKAVGGCRQCLEKPFKTKRSGFCVTDVKALAPPQCLVTRTEKSLFTGLSCRLCLVFGTNKADLVTNGRFFVGNPSPLFCRSVGVAERSRYTSFFRWYTFPNDCWQMVRGGM
jgi:hypothetical protein